MPQFIKRPVIIEAEQFTAAFTPDGVCLCQTQTAQEQGWPEQPHVHTAHAGQRVAVRYGDWIVPESKAPGKFYPIKDDVFRETYDPMPGEVMPPPHALLNQGRGDE